MSPTCTLLLTLSKVPSPALKRRLQELMAANAALPVLLVAHGDREAQEDGLRELGDACPALGLLRHTHHESTDQALAAGIAGIGSEWLAWIDLDRHADALGDTLSDAVAGTDDTSRLDWFRSQDGAIVFPRETWAKLRRLPWMSRVLPELLEQAGLTERTSPGRRSPGGGWIHALHALYIQAARLARPEPSWHRART